jgi:hypothetical protein
MPVYFDIFIGAPQQTISHISTQPHAWSTVSIRPHDLHAYLLPLTAAVFFAAGFAAAFGALLGAHFFVPHFFASGAAFVAVFGAAFFGAAVLAGFAGAVFFVAMLPPLQVV